MQLVLDPETPLGKRLRNRIRKSGPIGVDDLMRVALQDSEHGYYMRRDPIGREGDFVTAPEISQMFGELIAMWMADLWLRAGRPAPLLLVELGPGRGTMLADILRAARSVAGFREALRPVLVESGRALANRQQAALADSGAGWVCSVDEISEGPAFWLANEFFDALPIRQVVRVRDGWRERQVGIGSSGILAWRSGSRVQLPASLAPALAGAREGAVAEWSEDSEAVVRSIARRIANAGGAVLIIDYGYREEELARAGGCDTLQAVRNHRPVAVLEEIGEADLSAHVNFSALARVAVAEGALAGPVVPQGQFLEAIGLNERAGALARGQTASTQAVIGAARARLADPGGMGSLFRAVAFCGKGWPKPAGFDRTAGGGGAS